MANQRFEFKPQSKHPGCRPALRPRSAPCASSLLPAPFATSYSVASLYWFPSPCHRPCLLPEHPSTMAEEQDERPHCEFCNKSFCDASTMFKHQREYAKKPEKERENHPCPGTEEYHKISQKWFTKSKNPEEKLQRKSEANARYRAKEPICRRQKAEEYFAKLRWEPFEEL